MREAPNQMESFLMLQSLGDGQYAVQARNIWAADDQSAAAPTLSAATNLARVHGQQTELVPYPLIVPTPNSVHVGQQEVLAATWLHPVSLAEQERSFQPLQQLGTGTYGAYSSDLRASAAALTWPGATG